MIYLGADHRGFELKEFLKERLKAHNYDFEDVGAPQFDPTDDYPMIAFKVAKKIVAARNDADKISPPGSTPRGILICGSGIGMCFAADKIKGIRAGLGVKPEIIKTARHDDDINVLCLPSDFIESEQAWQLVEVFLNTPFVPNERFIRRLKEVEEFENS